jgi:hypothetical protein
LNCKELSKKEDTRFEEREGGEAALPLPKTGIFFFRKLLSEMRDLANC